MKKQNKTIDQVYIQSSNFGCIYVQSSGDVVGSTYTKEWFNRQVALNKIVQEVQQAYPDTPVLLHDAGHLMFDKDNDELSDEMNALYELLVMRHERKQKA